MVISFFWLVLPLALSRRSSRQQSAASPEEAK
jgi:hypothetical protein